MARRISCALTADAVRQHRKTVTRRSPNMWVNLHPGDRLTIVEQLMGLPPGAKQVVLADVEVVDVSLEPLGALVEQLEPRLWVGTDYGWKEMSAEGVDLAPVDFIVWWASTHHYQHLGFDELLGIEARRIEWRYVDSRSRPC